MGGYGSSYGGMGGMGGYGSSYGGMGGMGGYGSSYGGMGGYGSSMGGYGSSMGGYGGGGYGMGGGMGMNGMGMGMGGMMGPDGQMQDPSLSQRMEQGTMATFQILSSISAFFMSFSQLVDSTFMATHSSFFAMIGVAEQLGMVRNYLGSALNIFELIRWIRTLGNRALGRETNAITTDGFRAFESNPTPGHGAPPNAAAPRGSKKPMIIFLLTVIGLPWLLTRLVRLITARQALEARSLPANHLAPLPLDPNAPASAVPTGTPLDPASLLFTRALHAYAPPATSPEELAFAQNDIIAILSSPTERAESGWWRGRTRDGRVGWVPGSYLEVLPPTGEVKSKIGKEDDERAKREMGRGPGGNGAGGVH